MAYTLPLRSSIKTSVAFRAKASKNMWCRVKCENTKYWPDQRPQTYTAVGKNSSRQNIKNLIHINCLAADCRVESREELIELISFIFLSSLDSPGLEQLWFPSTGPTCPVLSFTTSWVSAPSPGLPLLSHLYLYLGLVYCSKSRSFLCSEIVKLSPGLQNLQTPTVPLRSSWILER